MKRAIFFDRDGILNRVVMRGDLPASPRVPSEFEVLPWASEMVHAAKDAGFLVIVATNQPDIGRGLMTKENLAAMHDHLQNSLPLDSIEAAISGEDSDPRRKPNPGMLVDAAHRFKISLADSWIVGDSKKDIQAGKNAGVGTILLQTIYNSAAHGTADFNFSSPREIINFIKGIAVSFSKSFLSKTAETASSIDAEAIEKMVSVLRNTRDNGGRLFFIGSGGGAGHASHATCDFRKLGGIETYCPTDNVSELTARINDEGWENSIADCLKSMRLRSGDAVFVFSVGGGNEEKNISVNLVNAVKLAKERGASVLGVVGRDGGYTASVADACVVVPTVDADLVTPLAESFQAVVWHLIVSHPDFQASTAKWESTK